MRFITFGTFFLVNTEKRNQSNWFWFCEEFFLQHFQLIVKYDGRENCIFSIHKSNKQYDSYIFWIDLIGLSFSHYQLLSDLCGCFTSFQTLNQMDICRWKKADQTTAWLLLIKHRFKLNGIAFMKWSFFTRVSLRESKELFCTIFHLRTFAFRKCHHNLAKPFLAV